MEQPTIITLELEKSAADFFTAQRTAYFPKHVNYLDAHLTLFHTIPEDREIASFLKEICKRPELELTVAGLQNIGNGVAYIIASAELKQLHRSMQKKFNSFLTRKDRQTIWPHITIQNKVSAYKALLLTQKLNEDFKPYTIKATGISTFKYLGGPWEQLEFFPFSSGLPG